MRLGLVERAMRGDQEAFAALAAESVDGCYRLAYRILRDPHRAQDASQQALLGAWRDLPTLRDPERFDAWLHRLVVNACYAEARRRRRWSEGVRLLPVEPVHGSDDYATVDNRDQLERAFRRLTVQQRAVLVFHHYLGLSLPEVAVRIGIPLGTVKSRMHHAKQALRASLDAEARSSGPSQERMA